MEATRELPDDLKRALDFHGHLCPGLLIGYRAAQAASRALQVGASEDEELVLIAENDSCSVDAFQSMLSTTFGKGNLIFRDYGKQVFTLGERGSGRAVRVALRHDALDALDARAPGDGTLDRAGKIDRLLHAEEKDLFNINSVRLELPAKARNHATVPCGRCGEGTMETRMIGSGADSFCLPCAGDLELIAGS